MYKYILLLLLIALPPGALSQIQELDLSVPFPGGVHGLPRENICVRSEHPNGPYYFTNKTRSVADLVVITYARVDDDLAIENEIIEEGDHKRAGCSYNVVHEWPKDRVLYEDVQPGQSIKLQVFDNVGWWVGARGIIGFVPKCSACTSPSGTCGGENGKTSCGQEGNQPSFGLGSKTNTFNHSLPKKLTIDTNVASPEHLTRFNLYQGEGQEGIEDNIFTPEGLLYQSHNSGGLTQLDVVDDNSYTLKQYSSSKVGPKDTNGHYTVTGTPDTVITFSKTTTKPNELNIEEKQGGLVVRNIVFSYDYSTETWQMGQDINGDGTIDVSEYETSVSSGDNTVKTAFVLDGNQAVVSKIKRTYDADNNLIEEVVDPDGAALTTSYTYTDGNLTRTDYPDGSFETITYTSDDKEELITRSSGLFTKYEYDVNGKTTKVIESFNGSTYTTNENDHKVTLYDYTPAYTGDDGSVEPDQARLVQVKMLGHTVSKTWYAYLV